MELAKLHPSHYRALWEICKEAEPYILDLVPFLEAFKAVMNQREGWTIIHEWRLVGAVTIGEYSPGHDATIHVFIEKAFHRTWNTPEINRLVFGYCFNTLNLPRVSGFCIAGVNEHVARFQEKLGFKPEGRIRNIVKLKGGFHDLIVCGMLKEECPWL